MTSFSDILAFSQHKTRVLIYTSHPKITKLTFEVLQFCGKEFDYFLADDSHQTGESDFVILETSDLVKAAEFKANIFLISTEINTDEINLALQNITPGGVLIYPLALENLVEESPYFFRKLPFSPSLFKIEAQQYLLETEIGTLPLLFKDENLINNLNGIKLLCQQFGVMEEEFYEPVMSFG